MADKNFVGPRVDVNTRKGRGLRENNHREQ